MHDANFGIFVRCPQDAPTMFNYHRSLYDFVKSALLKIFKNRKTVARRHVERAPYGDTAMIEQSPHDLL